MEKQQPVYAITYNHRLRIELSLIRLRFAGHTQPGMEGYWDIFYRPSTAQQTGFYLSRLQSVAPGVADAYFEALRDYPECPAELSTCSIETSQPEYSTEKNASLREWLGDPLPLPKYDLLTPCRSLLASGNTPRELYYRALGNPHNGAFFNNEALCELQTRTDDAIDIIRGYYLEASLKAPIGSAARTERKIRASAEAILSA